MPTLNWLGKDKVVNYAAKVPVHALNHLYNHGNADGNKIIHGDNLTALKSLLPLYEGRVKCIYIDPPYNTGNENWVYNDNVNSPQIKKWIGQVVGKEGEDLTRHDKWLCMMYPRLKLLKQLLSNDGAIFISIDDNEQANLKLICDEIFGSQNFVAQITWEKMYTTKNDSSAISNCHEYLISYAKNLESFKINLLPRTAEMDARYKNPDNDPRGAWKSDPLYGNGERSTGRYPVVNPKTGQTYFPPENSHWRYRQADIEKMITDNKIYWGKDGKSAPRVKKFLFEVQQGTKARSLWKFDEVGHNHEAKTEMKLLGFNFDTPKPTRLIERILQIATDKNSLVLDAFAGSGTTAHAVINLNAADGGNRKFILIEMEDYAESITAERVRRVGGAFNFYEVGEPLFVEGDINPDVDAEKIREYVWATETATAYEKPTCDDCAAFLGVHDNTAYYFHEGILDRDFLATMRTRADSYVIFAETCAVGEEFLRKYKIEFRKIPRDIIKIWSEDI